MEVLIDCQEDSALEDYCGFDSCGGDGYSGCRRD